MKSTGLIVLSIFFCWACSLDNSQKSGFELVEPGYSGVSFVNEIRESDSLNAFNFFYIYMGGGVGVGDFNNDGLPDLFFPGNMVSSDLYLNQGNFRFKEVTKEANLVTEKWVTGISVVDINNDGRQDLYLCVSGLAGPEDRKNLLFINDGLGADKIPRFKESAKTYGIADEGYATQAAFFDYDLDGDLDLYVMHHANEPAQVVEMIQRRNDGSDPTTDRLYENAGSDSLGHPYFREISQQAGIRFEGYGLGLSISDINKDNWPDIYVANDFIANDLLYINNKDGTFTEKLADYTNQSSMSGMGTDIADFNNDGLADIMVLDMLSESNIRQKTMMADMNLDYFMTSLEHGYSPQFIRNTLQLNRGIMANGGVKFSEIGRLAGVHQTDWSWAPLWADFDHDGFRDLFITNGYMRDILNHDFQSKQSRVLNDRTMENSRREAIKAIKEQKSVKIPNYIYKNKGGLQFEEQTREWGMDQASLSNGAAYADLDLDGDLDIVVNNINQPAFLYENKTRNGHFIKIRLKGNEKNRNALGSKIELHLPDGQILYHEHFPVRGYLSSVDPVAHFGLGNGKRVSSLTVTWPDGKTSVYHDMKADSTYYLKYEEAAFNKPNQDKKDEKDPWFTMPEIKGLNFTHKENDHIDFNLEPLLLQLYSRNGPGLAVGDVNGDGLEDVYAGGARNQAGQILVQKPGGAFKKISLDGSEKYEDMGALFFDADGDGYQDLYVVSGGSSIKYFRKGDYQDRLYFNDGKGNFTHNPDALPKIPASGSCVIAADYDQDGDLDLFVGGRIVPGEFPKAPRSYLLENESGNFRDVSTKVAPGIDTIGLVTGALWTDYDNDQDMDLMVVGEYMPLTLYENQNGKFTLADDLIINKIEGADTTQLTLNQTSGWWNSIIGADFDLDGDTDYVLGNTGHNTLYKASETKPVQVIAKDFDQNSTIDPVISRFMGGKAYPVAPRDAMVEQMNYVERVFPRYDQYGAADTDEFLKFFNLEDAIRLNGHQLASCYLENVGNNTFNMTPLPIEAQMAPIFGMLAEDFNNDGHPDILFVGNSRSEELINGWMDASYGGLLLGDGQGNFKFVENRQTGFWVEGVAKALVKLNGETGLYISGINDGPLQVYNRAAEEDEFIYPESKDAFAEIIYKDGSRQKHEFYFGQGYLSQTSRAIKVPGNVKRIEIVDFRGNRRVVDRLYTSIQ